ncbi:MULTISPECIES: ABC transporter family substrate-binding protein [unclassified Streptomyces]|uniref:ABC transporter family substrate-binding protein n=1 Tax=unclassified Streptomyces TaxID=2593676 RepID=UPI0038030756
MSQVEVPRGRTCSRRLRSVALLTGGVLALPTLSACTAGDDGASARPPAQDIAAAGRGSLADGGTVRWAVDSVPVTLNAFQADADATTGRIASAVLPALFTMDERGRPVRNPDFLESAEVVEREPQQVVLYKLNQQAVWSDGREIGAPDFLAQWRALSGKESAYWTARNAGYERIERIERGDSDLEVKVTFAKPYADWKALFTPLYPKDVTATPAAFNDAARTRLAATAGPFRIGRIDRKAETTTLVRNPRWWGERAKLESLVLAAVPRAERVAALAAGELDVAEIDRSAADRIAYAAKDAGRGGRPLAHGPGADLAPSAALLSWARANGSDASAAEAARATRERTAAARAAYAKEQSALKGFRVRKSLEPAYTQLAMNGESGPLADRRVRQAVARAIDRKELAESVLVPLGLPADPPGSHVALAGQPAYKDSSGVLGGLDTEQAQALLADAGWTPGGAVPEEQEEQAAGAEQEKADGQGAGAEQSDKPGGRDASVDPAASDEGLYIVGDDDKPAADTRAREAGRADTRVLAPAPAALLQSLAIREQARAVAAGPDAAGTSEAKGSGEGVSGAYAPRGTAAPSPAAAGGAVGKDGKPLTLRFVLPSGPGSEALRSVGGKISAMLERIGIRTEITKVADESYFTDHIASGDYDLALYSWPASAYPATDARPIHAKPRPASDGSLLVEQNYTRVGTDYIDQLFDQAAAELDEDEARDLIRRADARIWAAAGAVPLYQRPDLVAVKSSLANVGAFGFETPRYQDIGYRKDAAPDGAGGAEGATGRETAAG